MVVVIEGAGGGGSATSLNLGAVTSFALSSQTLTLTGGFIDYISNVGDRASISKVRFHIAVQSGNIAVALYDNDGTDGAPGTRLASSGIIACPAVGVADVALGTSVDLGRGMYFALWADNSTVSVHNEPDMATFTSTLTARRSYYQNVGSGGPAASATPTAGFRRGFIARGVA